MEMVEIYGTLGPACSDKETIEKMFAAGMTGMRLNLSHGGLTGAKGMVGAFSQGARAAGKEAQLLIDMVGPELRVGTLASPLNLVEGEKVILGVGGIPIPQVILPVLQKDQLVLLDDGRFQLRIVEPGQDHARGLVERGGLLKERKSIALPGAPLQLPAVSPRDEENLRLAGEYGVSGVMQPFVRGRQDLEELRTCLEKYHAGHLKIFAKIEDMAGVEKLPEFLPVTDTVVIARGDLGNAMDLWKLPGVQKDITAACRQVGKDCIVATHFLYSMEENPIPSRAEVSDIFNAVLDGATGLMISGETAIGKYPVEAIHYLAQTAKEALKYKEKRNI
jgi:pyruvate kinase